MILVVQRTIWQLVAICCPIVDIVIIVEQLGTTGLRIPNHFFIIDLHTMRLSRRRNGCGVIHLVSSAAGVVNQSFYGWGCIRTADRLDKEARAEK